MLVIRIIRRRRKAALGLRVFDIVEIGLFVPWTTLVFALREIENELHRVVGRDIAKERIVELAHGIQRFHEHVRVSDLSRQQMQQHLFGWFVVARLDERFVGLASARLGRNIGAKIAHDIAALIDIGRRPAASLAVQKMRTAAFEIEQRGVVNIGLVDFARMLRDQLADHFEMAEFLDGDVLKHVANAGVLDVEGLHPVLQRGGKFARRSAELLEEERAEARVRFAHAHGLNKFLAV